MNVSISTPKPRRVVIAVLVVLALAGVGFAIARTAAESDDLTTREVTSASGSPLEYLAARYEGLGDPSRAPGIATVVDALPNTQFVRSDGSKAPAYSHVVIGRVTNVTEGEGFFMEPPPDDPSDHVRGEQRTTSFDDPRAEWRTLRVTLDVEKRIGGSRVQSLELWWPIAGPMNPYPDADPSDDAQDPELTGQALRDLGRSVWFLQQSPTEPTGPLVVLDVPHDVLRVAADGRLSLAFDPHGVGFLGGIDTLTKLEYEAAKATRTKPAPGG